MTGEDGVPTLVTRVAHASWGDNRFRGFGVAGDLAGRVGRWSCVSLAVGHRVLRDNEAAAMDAMAVCTLSGDPRIYPLKAVRLVSSFGGLSPGLACGLLMAQGGKIGPAVAEHSATMLGDLAAGLVGAVATDESLRAFVEARRAAKGRFPGFGVPFRDADERLPPLRRIMRELGLADGRFWQLAHALDEILAPSGLPMNPAAAIAAALLDLGFGPPQIAALTVPIADINYFANAYEQATEPSQALQRLPRSCIDYRGEPARESPRKRAGERIVVKPSNARPG